MPLSKTQWPVLSLLLWQWILCSWLLLIWKPQVAISLTTNCYLLMSLYRPPWSVRLLGWGSIIICALWEGRSHLPIKHSSRRHVTYNKNPPSHPPSLQSGWLYVFYPLLRKKWTWLLAAVGGLLYLSRPSEHGLLVRWLNGFRLLDGGSCCQPFRGSMDN